MKQRVFACAGGAIFLGMFVALGYVASRSRHTDLSADAHPDMQPDATLSSSVGALSSPCPGSVRWIDATAETSGGPLLPQREVAGSSPAPGAFDAATRWAADGELDEHLLPTAAGLYARTVGTWDQPEFLELTDAEARELFPLDDELAATPATLLAAFGDLPTLDDCERALDSERITRALEIACLAEIRYAAACDIVPPDDRTPAMQSAIEELRTEWFRCEEDLWKLLDKATGHEWTLWGKAWRRWQAE